MRLLSSLWQQRKPVAVAIVPLSCVAIYLANAEQPILTTPNKTHLDSSSCPDNNMMRTALVVGGTSGIGHGIALALAKKGDITVTIAGRSQERGAEIVQQLNAASKSERHSFRQVDAFDLNSVAKLADVNADLLVMTQGMATTQGYTPTVNGIDQKLQLHYFSRVYLARLMASKMAQKPSPKVLTVLSGGVHSRYNKFDSDFELKDSYSVKNAADAAGFYTDAGFESLSKEVPSVTFCHAAPGFVNTNWGTEFPWYLRAAVRCMQPLGRSPEKCGELLTEGWLNLPSSEGNNFYLMDQNGKVIADGIKHTAEERELIWSKTLELLPDI